MKLTEDFSPLSFQIKAYAPGEIKIDQEVFRQSLLISQEGLDLDWLCPRLEDLNATLLSPILAYHPECVIFGSGPKLIRPHPRYFAQLIEAGIGYEVMDTAAACRTLVALFSEGRRVMGALLP